MRVLIGFEIAWVKRTDANRDTAPARTTSCPQVCPLSSTSISRGGHDPVTILLRFSARLSRAAANEKPIELSFREEKMPDRWNSLYQAARD
jgi:hypothetical protein